VAFAPESIEKRIMREEGRRTYNFVNNNNNNYNKIKQQQHE